MTAWMWALVALVPALALPVLAAARGDVPRRLAAAQLCVSIALQMLVCASFAFEQPSYLDLALTLCLLTVPGTLATTLFLERWL